MSSIAIDVRNLGKLYRIGTDRSQFTLREALTNSLLGPVRALRSRQGVKPSSAATDESEFWALRDLSFSINQGDVVGVVGRNGAGKSTLLKILSRITAPTTGEVTISGRVGSLLEVGTGFHPELTGRENIRLNGAILGMRRPEIARKFDQIVAFAEVERFLDTPVKHYSSGMYTRLAFAVAAHLDPEILVVDEVLAVGDAQFQKKCLGKMNEVAREGRTVLFVSHNMSAILSLCSTGIWLDSGRCRKIGAIQEVVQSYATGAADLTKNDLAEVGNRSGAGNVRFTRYWLESPRGTQVPEAISGQEVHVVLEYAGVRPISRNCRVAIGVNTLLGQPLFVCSTELTMTSEMELESAGLVVCTIPAFPLTSGEYAMTLFLESDREVEDWIQSSARLSVMDGDFFGTGRQVPAGWEGKSVIVPHGWHAERPTSFEATSESGLPV